jgi:hypothetical protein
MGFVEVVVEDFGGIEPDWIVIERREVKSWGEGSIALVFHTRLRCSG